MVQLLNNASNTKKQGDIGLGYAIAYFAGAGYTVSIPLTDSQDYDLVVDNGTLQRVQVKTTKHKSVYGIYTVSLTIKGGNQTFSTIKKFDPTKVDLIFILCDNEDKYLIPSNIIITSINLGKKYQKYKI